MLTTVEVYSPRGETLALPLQDVSNGYVVKDVEGLDPVEATIISSTFAQLDGTQYQGARRESRNLVLKLGFEPNHVNNSVSSLRNHLYRFFMPKSLVTLRFYIDGLYFASITGRVESFGAPQFTKEPGADISILCFDSDFIAPSSVVVPGNTVSTTTEQVIPYPGTIEAGVVFKLMVDRALTSFMIYSRPAGGDYQAMEFAGALQAGDVLEISTVPGNKRALLTRAGAQTSILYAISPTSTWFKLFPGDNQFRVQAGGAAIPFTIEYTARYGGL